MLGEQYKNGKFIIISSSVYSSVLYQGHLGEKLKELGSFSLEKGRLRGNVAAGSKLFSETDCERTKVALKEILARCKGKKTQTNLVSIATYRNKCSAICFFGDFQNSAGPSLILTLKLTLLRTEELPEVPPCINTSMTL